MPTVPKDEVRTVHITRTVEIEVKIGHYPGTSHTWHQPGDPDAWWIIESSDDDGDDITLTESEKKKAIKLAGMTPSDQTEPEPDHGPVDLF